jgi:signal transduction histidine kinase/CheY-like chemotaxis protein/purine-cytosine permease-like protein
VHPSGPQRIVKVRRDYNSWVATETLEDYALRYTPGSFRRWSEFRVANTAFGAVSFLALEAIGGSIAISYGFTNAFWAILAVGVIIFLTALPIAYYGAKHNIDMDLLTRGAGFGYIGSTITSLIYASFTFIFFALEAAIMAMAIELYFDIPLGIGYVLSSLVIIPLVTHGVTFLSRLQLWTQPLWLVLMLLPFGFIAVKNPQAFSDLASFGGKPDSGTAFDPLLFGAAATVAFSLITQIAEQVDFLRFLPERTAHNRKRWWTALLVAGPGWIVLGGAKLLGGAFLAFLALQHEIGIDKASEPTQMYLVGFNYVFADPGLALAAVTLFVIVSQIKINVTNAYAGSLAWSNFFSRLTHSHPGRVVWLVFNVVIAILLMKLGIFGALEKVLGLYSNVAIAWVGALVADLVVNKPLGLSPPYVEFKRAHLYDINPVGVGSMLIASVVSITAFSGAFGALAQALAPFIALTLAFVLAPVIALLTRGRYYIARQSTVSANSAGSRCCICEHEFEAADMAHCPAYEGPICSLCCTLDARCHDACKPGASLREQLAAFVQVFVPAYYPSKLRARIGSFVLRFIAIAGLAAAVFGIVYYQQTLSPVDIGGQRLPDLYDVLSKTFLVLLVPIGIGTWLLTLKHESHLVAQEESNKQTRLLQQEIAEHQKTDAQLQLAKEQAERANQAKSRFLTGMSHELRTPLNSILGYAQLLQNDAAIPVARRQALGVIRQSGEHLLMLINDILDVARNEAGQIKLAQDKINFPEFLQQIVRMFRLQAEDKGIVFRYQALGDLPPMVRADEKRLRQILINLLANAMKFTEHGEVALIVTYKRAMTRFQIKDTGAGIRAQDLEQIFQPFQRGPGSTGRRSEGIGLGLTISRMLTELMGGVLSVESAVGVGSTFQVKVPLPEIAAVQTAQRSHSRIVGYRGQRRALLIVDDQPEHRHWLMTALQPLGFQLRAAADGVECLRQAEAQPPDAVLIDLIMPHMDGFEATRRLRANPSTRGSVIVAVSANAFAEDREQCIAAGCNDFIPKPIDLDDLLATLKVQLGLEWIHENAARSDEQQANVAQRMPAPPADLLQELLDVVRIGYVKGLLENIERIERLDERYAPFAQLLRRLAREFRLTEITEVVQTRLESGHVNA